jgi:hypothetical protein
MESNASSEAPVLERLFQKAKECGKFDYLYTLVRIDGMQCYDTRATKTGSLAFVINWMESIRVIL